MALRGPPAQLKNIWVIGFGDAKLVSGGGETA